MRRRIGAATGDADVWTSSDQTAIFPSSVNIGALAAPGGLLKVTIAAGVATPSIATAGTDYVQTVSVTAPITNTGTAANPNIALDYDGVSLDLDAGTTLRRAALTGDITASAGSNTTAFRNFSALSVLGRTANSTGAPGDIAAMPASGHVLRESGSTIGWGTIGASAIPALNATFITQTASADLANEQALGSLSSGVLSSVTATGVVSSTAFTAGRIAYGSGTNGTLTEEADFNYDAANNSLAIGITSPGSGTVAHLKKTAGALGTNLYVQNPSTATATTNFSGLTIGESDTMFATGYFGFWRYNSTVTPGFGAVVAGTAQFQLFGGTGNIFYDLFQNSGAHIFATTTSQTERLRIYNNGDVTVSTGLATNATSGWLHLSSSAGPPTGLSTSYNAGATVAYHDDRTNKRLYRNVPGSTTWDIVGQYLGGLTTNHLLQHTGGGVVGGVAIPTDNRIVYGTGTALNSSNEIRIDQLRDSIWISKDGYIDHQNSETGSFQSANYDRVRAQWDSNVWILKSEKGGSGTVRSMTINADTATLTLTGASVTGAATDTLTLTGTNQVLMGTTIGTDPDIYIAPTAVNLRTNNTIAMSAGATWNGLVVSGTATFTGSATITAAFASTSFNNPVISGSAGTVNEGANIYVAGPLIASGGVAINANYALWVDDGAARFDGGSSSGVTIVFELPADTTTAGSHIGRIPCLIGGNLRYLHYYDG